MLELVIYCVSGSFGILQIFVGIYWFYVIIRDHYRSMKPNDMRVIKKTEMKAIKSISTSANEPTTTNVTDSSSVPSSETSPKNDIESNKKNSSTLPFNAKLYTSISILGYTLFCSWIILYFATTIVRFNGPYVNIYDILYYIQMCTYISLWFN